MHQFKNEIMLLDYILPIMFKTMRMIINLLMTKPTDTFFVKCAFIFFLLQRFIMWLSSFVVFVWVLIVPLEHFFFGRRYMVEILPIRRKTFPLPVKCCKCWPILLAIEQQRVFSVPHLLWQELYVFNGHLWGLVTPTHVAERLAVELSLPVLMT